MCDNNIYINYKDEALLKFFCRVKILKFYILRNMETTIDFHNLSSETKDDILSRTKQHKENIDEFIVSEYGEDNYAVTYSKEQHMENIDRIIVSEYSEDNYVVTYSRIDNSLLGWTINIEQNGQQLPHVYFKLDQFYDYIGWFKLCKKTLLFCYREHSSLDFESYDYCKYLF